MEIFYSEKRGGGGSTVVRRRFSGSTAPLPSSTQLNQGKPLCAVPDPNQHLGTHHEPGSRLAPTCPAQFFSVAFQAQQPVGEGTTATRNPPGAPRATGSDKAEVRNAGPRGTQHRHADGHNPSTAKGAKQHGDRMLLTIRARTSPRANAQGPQRAREHAGRTETARQPRRTDTRNRMSPVANQSHTNKWSKDKNTQPCRAATTTSREACAAYKATSRAYKATQKRTNPSATPNQAAPKKVRSADAAEGRPADAVGPCTA